MEGKHFARGNGVDVAVGGECGFFIARRVNEWMTKC
jgi:hypothetical protein